MDKQTNQALDSFDCFNSDDGDSNKYMNILINNNE